ncbi:MAG: flagellar filament capping protein FliD [Thermocrinis sp.]|nr:flagellar filament capping protein FliD [Thermocrinis sp.]
MAGEIYLSNLTGKLDWGSIVDQILHLKSLPLERMTDEENQLKAKQESLSELANAIDAFNNLFSNLSVDDLFKSKSATSSNTGVLTATATAETPNVTLNVSVTQLSSKEVRLSEGGVSDLSSNISWPAFTITYKKGPNPEDVETFNVEGGSGTLKDLVDKINQSAGSVIVASVFYDGSQYRLMLSEKDEALSTVETNPDTGTYVISTSGLVINGQSDLDNTPLQQAKNAKVQIGTTTVQSPTDRIENVLPGLTLELKATGNATVSVGDDYSKVKDFFADFVAKYNAVIKQVNEMTDKDKGLFQGDQTITGVKNTLADMLDPLFKYGIVSYNEDGTLTFNSSAVDDLANKNPQELRDLVETVKTNYGSYLEDSRITFQSFINDYQSRIDSLNQRIAEFQEQLSQEEQKLRLEFSKVEMFMNQAQETMDRIKNFMVSLSEMQGGNK